MENLQRNNVTLKGKRDVDLLQGSEVISKINIEKNNEEVWKKEKKRGLCVELENIAEMKKFDDFSEIRLKSRPYNP